MPEPCERKEKPVRIHMSALPLRYSVADDDSRKTPRQPKMPDPITEAVHQAQQAAMTADGWYNLGLAFLIGGAVSAVWTWREGKRKPKGAEIFSTFLCSGAIAVAIVAYLMGKNITTPMVICISILTGFSGEMIIRILIRAFVGIAKRVAGVPDSREPQEKEE